MVPPGGAIVQLNSHFLKEVPEGDDLQLLQDKKDAAADEEVLVFGQGFVQQQQISLAETHTHTHTHTHTSCEDT